MPVELQCGAASKVNEDSYLVAPPLFVVADGMGGHQGGDVASRLVVEEFDRLRHTVDSPLEAGQVADALARAQARIVEYIASQRVLVPGWHAGTTVVVAALIEDAGAPKWLLANIGDSRIYRLGEEGLEQVSVDHSVVQELIEAGEITAAEAQTHPERHVITRALGNSSGVEADFFLIPVVTAPRILLCSDGVSGMISDARIEELLAEVADPGAAAAALIQAAMSAGGRDNATAIVVDVVGLSREAAYDTARQRESIENKLGGRA